MQITDKMLRENVEQAREDWLNSLPQRDQIPEASVSQQFEERMNDLLQRFGFSYLSIFASDDTAAEKIFLLSASDGQREKGTGKDDAFLFATSPLASLAPSMIYYSPL